MTHVAIALSQRADQTASPGGETLRWYALTVKPRHDRVVADHLRQKGLDEFSPVYRTTRRWSDRVKEVELYLFPGYVFCRFTYRQQMQVLNTPSVTSIVSFGKQPTPVEDSELLAVRTILASGHSAGPWPYLQMGQRVRVEGGCLAGLTGMIVREKDVFRVVVNLELLQRSVAVEVDRDLISPIKSVSPGTDSGCHSRPLLCPP